MCENANGQKIELQIKALEKTDQQKIDSIGFQTSHKNLKKMEIEVDSIIMRFKKAGFLDTSQTSKTKKNDSLYTYFLRIGALTEKTTIYFTTEAKPELPAKLKDKDSISILFTETERFLKSLNEEMANNGKPLNSIQLKNINRSKGKLTAELQIYSTKERSLDQIILKGYEEFPKNYLKNYLGFRKGKKFSKKEIDKKIEYLKEIDFATSTRQPEILFTKDSTTLYLYLEKQNSNNFDGFLGFSNEEGSSRLKLNGYLNLKLANNLNFGEELIIEYKNNGESFSFFKAETLIPYVFNTPISIEAELNLTKQDSTFSTNSQKAGLSYGITPNLNTSLGYKSETSTFLLNNESLVSVGDAKDYNAQFGVFGVRYSKKSPNKIFNLKSSAKLAVEVGERVSGNENTPQQRYTFDGERNFSLNYRNKIYIANHTGYINSKNYLTNELYRTGGIKNMRGFQENSLIADFYTFFNTEYRYLLDTNFYANSIFDFGQLQNTAQNLDTRLYSFGFGLGIITKSGILRLLFANGKTEQQNFEFRNTKIHLSLTASF